MFRVNIYSTLSLVPSLPVGCVGFVLVGAFAVLVLNVCLWTLPYLDNSRKLFMQKVQTFNTNPKLKKQKWQKWQLASYWVENHNPLTATVTAGKSVLGVKWDPRPRGEWARKMGYFQHFHICRLQWLFMQQGFLLASDLSTSWHSHAGLLFSSEKQSGDGLACGMTDTCTTYWPCLYNIMDTKWQLFKAEFSWLRLGFFDKRDYKLNLKKMLWVLVFWIFICSYARACDMSSLGVCSYFTKASASSNRQLQSDTVTNHWLAQLLHMLNSLSILPAGTGWINAMAWWCVEQ